MIGGVGFTGDEEFGVIGMRWMDGKHGLKLLEGAVS
jgi:hypothetical protein